MERAQSASKENITDEEIPLSPPVNKLSPLVARPTVETEEERAINYGPYREKYETLHSIGKGAFGFVKIALRKEDLEEVNLLVIYQSAVTRIILFSLVY